MRWLELSVNVSREDIDMICSIFNEMGTGGAVIEDPALIYDLISKGNRETVAFEVTVEPQSSPVVKGYLPVDDKLNERVAEFIEALGMIDGEYQEQISTREIDDEDWLNSWKEYYHPFRVGHSLMVRPSWMPTEPMIEELRIIEIDPGMAFGCGTHPTTEICMLMLEDVIAGGETVLDVGTGSGILAITAGKLGAAKVVAVDTDSIAVRTALENVAINGLENIIEVQVGNLLDGIDSHADIIVANIVADVIILLLPSVILHLSPGGKFIASGIIAARKDEVAGAITTAGLKIKRTVSQGEWTAFLAEK